MKRRTGQVARVGGARRRGLSPRPVGAAVLVGLVLVALLSFNKSRIETELTSGDDLQAEFARQYKVDPYESNVKIAGVVVGSVTGVERTERGTVLVSMRLEPGVRDTLGSEPSATIRPALVVGGRYFVELSPGGTGGTPSTKAIPVERTSVPVELDRVLSSVDGEAGDAVRGTVQNLDRALADGGRKQLKRLLADSPETLVDVGAVAEALRGQRPAEDLGNLVTGLRSTAATLTEEQGRMESIFASLNDSSAALADASGSVARAVEDGPETLRVTRVGLEDLGGTLDELTSTARSLRPTVKQLDPLLASLEPVLDRTEPLLKDLGLLMDDAQPLVRDLAPSVTEASRILDDVDGPVMDRVNGEIADFVLNPWTGTGRYENGGNSHKLYEEAGYLTVAGARVFQTHDANGSQGRLMAGVGLRSLGGSAFPNSLEQYIEDIFGLHMPLGPQEGKEKGGRGQDPILGVPDLGGLGTGAGR